MTKKTFWDTWSGHVPPHILDDFMRDVDKLLAEELGTLVDTANYVRRLARRPEDLHDLAITLCQPCRAALDVAAAKVPR